MNNIPKYKIEGNSIVRNEKFDKLHDPHAFKKIAGIIAGSTIISAVEAYCVSKKILPPMGNLEQFLIMAAPVIPGAIIGRKTLGKYAASQEYIEGMSTEPNKLMGSVFGTQSSLLGIIIGYGIGTLIGYLAK